MEETARGGAGTRQRGRFKQAKTISPADCNRPAYIFPSGQAHGSSSMVTTGRTNAATQTELLYKHVIPQVSSCGMCEGIFLEVESDCKQACGRCDQIDELLCLVAELQEEVSRLRSI